MSYYDNVKDSVKDKGGEGNSNHKASFDTLKEAAEESSEEEEEDGDDTPIEVLEEDGLQKQPSNSSKTSPNSRSKDENPLTSSSSDSASSSGNADMSSVENKLDRIIEQNQRMIEILESFGQ
ncbi:MAG: hypothetical protein H8Z69_05305 [Nanohaloarchaea archaeon]|nr:hypothetical protein [Candidatus Nanohaloarchaea archaeon]